MGSNSVARCILFKTRTWVPLDLIPALDQPNRALRTRMMRGVGGTLSDGRSYPDRVLVFDCFTNTHTIAEAMLERFGFVSVPILSLK